jgi:lipoate---protein ligase
MRLLDQTLPTQELNLALDEALLDWCEEDGGEETLRFWEPTHPFVVLGHSNRLAAEVNLSACERLGVPVLRRCSGGGTVLQASGCLDYALILRCDREPDLANVARANRFIMVRHRDALSAVLAEPMQVEGVTDLAIAGRKFSGNAQRRRRRFLLFHGTILLSLDLGLVEQVLSLPSRQPDYRNHRPHLDFLRNLGISAHRVKEALRECWAAEIPLDALPTARMARLVQMRYAEPAWTQKF